jgi:predicted SAM-dependent methyltransferase
MQFEYMQNLINKTIKSFQKEGNKYTILKIINFFLIRKFNIKIVNDESNTFSKRSKKIFKDKKIIYSSAGYLMLNPMPSNLELDLYYTDIYWKTREGKNYGVNLRDILHFYLIKNFILKNKNKDCELKKFVNFGAGHVGISYNMWFEGFEVINVEPSHLPISFENNWENYHNLSRIADNSIDFFYASHSIEHVNDIEELFFQIKRILKKNAYIFIEVPNANWRYGGAINGQVDIPHTYYFTKLFFQKIFKETLLNECFDENHSNGDIYNWNKSINEHGNVIRYIGKNT